MSVVEVRRGDSPVILAFPHVGTDVPPTIWDRLNDHGRRLADTDWHVHTLYADLLPAATTVRAGFHRYVIDANRDPDGRSLYPGQNTTGLVPTTDFDGQPIWRAGQEPDETDTADRLARFHGPYHAALAAEVGRVKGLHGLAVVYDCHSIRSQVPFLFAGRLPDFNLGTDGGQTCAPGIEAAAVEVTSSAAGYTSVLNGRFKGGWTTRHYGRPENRVHAIQMELAQSIYLSSEAPPFPYDPAQAAKLRAPLKLVLERIEQTALALKAKPPTP